MIKIGLADHFDAAHFLRSYEGKCANMHGHCWNVQVSICGEKDEFSGMLLDFTVLKQILREELNKYDHRIINEIAPFDKKNPTAENLAEEIFNNIKIKLPENVVIKSVTVWESPKAWAEYSD